MKAALYARVSTADKGQDPEVQLVELREYAGRREILVVQEFVDVGHSGAQEKRPGLDKLLLEAWDRRFDLVIVWSLDRFSRSLKHLVNTVAYLGERGIGFISLKQHIDFSTSTGKLMFHLVSAFAEFERDLLRERVRAGIHQARENGVRLGRPPIPQETAEEIVSLRRQGAKLRQIAAVVGMSVSGVYKTLKKQEMEKEQKQALPGVETAALTGSQKT